MPADIQAQFSSSRELIKNIHNSFHKLRDRAERMAERSKENATDLLMFGKELRCLIMQTELGLCELLLCKPLTCIYRTHAVWPQPRGNLLLSSFFLEDFAYHIDIPWNHSIYIAKNRSFSLVFAFGQHRELQNSE